MVPRAMLLCWTSKTWKWIQYNFEYIALGFVLMYLHGSTVCTVDILEIDWLREITQLVQLPDTLIATGQRIPQLPSTVTPSNFSILSSLELHGLNPETWILGVLGRKLFRQPTSSTILIGLCFLSQTRNSYFGWVFLFHNIISKYKIFD